MLPMQMVRLSLGNYVRLGLLAGATLIGGWDNSRSLAATWDGGAVPPADNNWMSAANWVGDLAPVPGAESLVFAGTTKLANNNDFPADSVFVGADAIQFDATAGSFTLGGNSAILNGNLTSLSANPQTIGFETKFDATAARIINGGTAGLTLSGGITGAAATGAMHELQLRGAIGNIRGVISSGPNTNAGLRLNVGINNAVDNNDAWSIGGNSTSSFGGQLFITRGTLNYGIAGDANNAPVTTVTRVSGGNTGEMMTVGNGALGTTGTFNMNNGSLTLNDGQNNTGTTAVRVALGNTATAAGPGSDAFWNQAGGTVTLQGFNLGGTPGVFGANQFGVNSAFNISGGLFDAGTAPFNVAVRAVGALNLSGTGILRSTGMGVNPSNAFLGLTLNDDRQGAGNLPSVGTVNLNAGGSLEVAAIRMTRNAGGQAVNSVFNFNGGTLKATASNATYMVHASSGTLPGNDISAVNVKAGGAIIDTNGFDIGIALPLLHDAALGATADGGLRKLGAGILTLAPATPSTYTGSTLVQGGTLSINSPYLADAAGVDVSTGALLSLDFAGEDTIASLMLGGVAAGNGVWGPVGSGAANTSSLLMGTGFLRVGAPMLLGDYDASGKVDAADYVLWRNSVGQTSTFPNDPNVGTIVGDNQYITWRSNFGNPGPGSSAVAEQSSAVPEPSSAMLVVSAIAAVGFAARRSKRV